MSLKISELPVANAIQGTELLAVVQGGSTKRTTIADVLSTVPAGEGGAATVSGLLVAVVSNNPLEDLPGPMLEALEIYTGELYAIVYADESVETAESSYVLALWDADLSEWVAQPAPEVGTVVHLIPEAILNISNGGDDHRDLVPGTSLYYTGFASVRGTGATVNWRPFGEVSVPNRSYNAFSSINVTAAGQWHGVLVNNISSSSGYYNVVNLNAFTPVHYKTKITFRNTDYSPDLMFEQSYGAVIVTPPGFIPQMTGAGIVVAEQIDSATWMLTGNLDREEGSGQTGQYVDERMFNSGNINSWTTLGLMRNTNRINGFVRVRMEYDQAQTGTDVLVLNLVDTSEVGVGEFVEVYNDTNFPLEVIIESQYHLVQWPAATVANTGQYAGEGVIQSRGVATIKRLSADTWVVYGDARSYA